MSANRYMVDSGGTTRHIRKRYVVDNGGVSRLIKKRYVIDSGGFGRLTFILGYAFTITAATQTSNTGYSNSGGGGGTYGSISAPPSGGLPSGKFINAIFDNTTGLGAALVVSNLSSDPGQGSLVEIILNGHTFSGTSASYLYSGSSARWSWGPSFFGLANGVTYSGFIISSGVW